MGAWRASELRNLQYFFCDGDHSIVDFHAKRVKWAAISPKCLDKLLGFGYHDQATFTTVSRRWGHSCFTPILSESDSTSFNSLS